MFIAATTDPFVTLAFFAAVALVFIAAGALGEKFLMRRDRRRKQLGRVRRYSARSAA